MELLGARRPQSARQKCRFRPPIQISRLWHNFHRQIWRIAAFP